jgi:plasmid stabilization system protein ParE
MKRRKTGRPDASFPLRRSGRVTLSDAVSALPRVITGTATADLDEIEDYWIAQGEAQRGDRHFHDLIDAAEQQLADGRAARRGRAIAIPGHPDARFILVFGVDRIIYRIDESAGVVNVLRFWHAHRDEPGREA